MLEPFGHVLRAIRYSSSSSAANAASNARRTVRESFFAVD